MIILKNISTILLLKNFNDLIAKERRLDGYNEEYVKFDKLLYELEDYFYTEIFNHDLNYDGAVDKVINILGRLNKCLSGH